MKFISLTFFAVMLCVTPVLSQDFKHYVLDAIPQIHTLPDSLKSYIAVHVLESRTVELRSRVFAGASQSPYISYLTEHRITHMNSLSGIEKFNRVYIPINTGQDLVSFEVRSIDPSGKFIMIEKNKLKELKNVEGGGSYKIFAVDGLVVGGEMEYQYTLSSTPRTLGKFTIQHEIPVMDSRVTIVSPKRFEYVAKCYNGLQQPETVVSDGRKRVMFSQQNIPAFVNEQYSASVANLMHFDYKIEDGGGVDPMDWTSLSSGFITRNFDVEGDSKVKKMLSGLHIEGRTEKEQVLAVESYIKTNISIVEGVGAYYNVKQILENHTASGLGIVRLYFSCWEQLRIVPELVLASDRFNNSLDPDFAMPNSISDILFHFPLSGLYLVPDVTTTRLGPPPNNIAGSQAVFIKFVFQDGRAKYVRHAFRTLTIPSLENNKLGITATIHFDGTPAQPNIDLESFWQGSRAMSLRGAFHFIQPNKKEEFMKLLALGAIDNPVVQKQTVEGEDIELSSNPATPLKVFTKFTAPSLVEVAGEDYLISVGKLIGNQSQLYQEKVRKMDIEFHEISDYHHQITLEIPDGYLCSGLESAKIDNVLKKGDEEIMKFSSDYTQTGNQVIITAREFYNALKVPKEQYEQFRKVVNSSADFSKLVLVLHPK